MKFLLFAGVLGMAILTACGGKKSVETSGKDGVKIAYYIEDSVATAFEFYTTNKAIMDEKFKSFEDQLIKLQTEGQNLLDQYNKKMSVGLLSPNQQKGMEAQLQQKQAQIQMLQQTDGLAIEKETAELNERLVKKMEKYGKEFSEQHGYSALFAKKMGSGILYMDSTLNVTKDFIDYMNAQEKNADKE